MDSENNISPALFEVYKSSLIDRIFKLLPLKEEDCETIDQYIDSLNHELAGMASSMIQEEATVILSIIHLLNHVKVENEHKIYRRDILKCCSLMKKVGDSLV